MRTIKCDRCEEDIERGELYYEKQAAMMLYVTPCSEELHFCSGCFNSTGQAIKDIHPKLIYDFVEMKR